MQTTPLQIVLWTSAWTAVGWVVSNYLAIGRDSSSKRKRYQSFIELLKKQTESRFAGAFFLEHKTTFSEFDKEALEVRPHIKKQVRFDAACMAYREVTFSILNDKHNAESKIKLLAILDELLTYAK